MLTDSVALSHLRQVGRQVDPSRILEVTPAAGVPSLLKQAVQVRSRLREAAADLIHVALPSSRYLPALWLALPGKTFSLCMTMTDCSVAHALDDRALRADPAVRRAYWLYRLYFSLLPLDGILSWYKVFAQRAASMTIRGNPLVYAVKHRFVDTSTFVPAPSKERRVVWAGRVVGSKRPDLFVEAVRVLRSCELALVENWSFEMYGMGPQESLLRTLITERGLDDVIQLSSADHLGDVYARASAYVSTQEFDNFTSLAMLEAMASGNAIVSRNVGQTEEFVWQGRNGILSSDDSPAAIADALANLLRNPASMRRMGHCSRDITLNHHCAEHFAVEMEDFWDTALQRSAHQREEARVGGSSASVIS